MSSVGSVYHALPITNLAPNGYGICSVQTRICFVSNALPNEIVDIQIIQKKRQQLFAIVLKYHTQSAERIDPFCKHFSHCGGCAWQYLSYQNQLKYKQQFVFDILSRTIPIQQTDIAPIRASPQSKFYRNKLEYSFSARRWLSTPEIQSKREIDRRAIGFHKAGRFDQIIAIEYCWLQRDPSNQVRAVIAKYAIAHNISFYNRLTHSGLLRSLIIRTSNTGQTMVLLIVAAQEPTIAEAILAHTQQTIPDITMLCWAVNDTYHDGGTNHAINHTLGATHLTERYGDYRFHVSPQSFLQTNSAQSEFLYRCIAQYAALTGDEVVYDLYSGIGTIAIFVAARAKHVWIVEQERAAIQGAEYNCAINAITNVSFCHAPVERALQQHRPKNYSLPDVVIIDPPRGGMHPTVIDMLLSLLPKKIIYVSCNLVTQARDVALLLNAYAPAAIQPFDMFPHTIHIENIILLQREERP